MSIIIRKFKNSPRYQGVDEEVAYLIDTGPWGGTPSVVSNVIKDAAGVDISEAKLSGDPSVSGDEITTSVVKLLVDKDLYRFEVKFTSGGNIFEAFGDIYGQT